MQQSYQFNKNLFNVGNIEDMMNELEKLNKLDSNTIQALRKIERQYEEFQSVKSLKESVVFQSKTGKTEEIIQNFQWDNQQFNQNQSIQEVICQIQDKFQVIDQDLKKKITQYSEIKQKKQNIEFKEGNYNQIDLSDVIQTQNVEKNDFVFSKLFSTLICIVNQSNETKFLENYENSSDFIVPQSAKKLNIKKDKDGNYLYVIKIINEDYRDKELKEKYLATLTDQEQKKIQFLWQRSIQDQVIQGIKEKMNIICKFYQYETNKYENRQKEREKIEKQLNNTKSVLIDNCKNKYGELFSYYIHIQFLKAFIELGIRFDISQDYLQCIIKPSQGKEKDIQTKLINVFGDKNSIAEQIYGTKEELEEAEDFFPFIYIPINYY